MFGDLVNPPDREGKEKHEPVIVAPDRVKKGEWFDVEIIVGKEMAHPNTLEHHIEGISIFYKEDGNKPVYRVADLTAFPVHADSRIRLRMRVDSAGYIHALSSCNIHGLWESEKRIEVE